MKTKDRNYFYEVIKYFYDFIKGSPIDPNKILIAEYK